MSDEPLPALTAGNWAQLAKFPFQISEGRLCEWTGVGLVVHEQVEAIIALANAALPDDSPYKITRADAEEVRDIAEYYVHVEGYSASDPSVALLFALAAKLTALLPPSGDTP